LPVVLSVENEGPARNWKLKAKPRFAGLFAEPSDGLEPSTPSLPSSGEAGSAGKRGNSRARKPRKKKETAEDE